VAATGSLAIVADDDGGVPVFDDCRSEHFGDPGLRQSELFAPDRL
jgi:hypothetical protein